MGAPGRSARPVAVCHGAGAPTGPCPRERNRWVRGRPPTRLAREAGCGAAFPRWRPDSCSAHPPNWPADPAPRHTLCLARLAPRCPANAGREKHAPSPTFLGNFHVQSANPIELPRGRFLLPLLAWYFALLPPCPPPSTLPLQAAPRRRGLPTTARGVPGAPAEPAATLRRLVGKARPCRLLGRAVGPMGLRASSASLALRA